MKALEMARARMLEAAAEIAPLYEPKAYSDDRQAMWVIESLTCMSPPETPEQWQQAKEKLQHMEKAYLTYKLPFASPSISARIADHLYAVRCCLLYIEEKGHA